VLNVLLQLSGFAMRESISNNKEGAELGRRNEQHNHVCQFSPNTTNIIQINIKITIYRQNVRCCHVRPGRFLKIRSAMREFPIQF
jgi:hypothetical protein